MPHKFEELRRLCVVQYNSSELPRALNEQDKKVTLYNWSAFKVQYGPYFPNGFYINQVKIYALDTDCKFEAA